MTLDCSNVLHSSSPFVFEAVSTNHPDPKFNVASIRSAKGVIEDCLEFLHRRALIKQSLRHSYFSF